MTPLWSTRLGLRCFQYSGYVRWQSGHNSAHVLPSAGTDCSSAAVMGVAAVWGCCLAADAAQAHANENEDEVQCES